MKRTITQYVALGVMLLIIVLIVSFLPAQHASSVSGKQLDSGKVAPLSVRNNSDKIRAD